ncbi:MAG: inositol monophosphatase [Nitriliruptoraceae bacterium]
MSTFARHLDTAAAVAMRLLDDIGAELVRRSGTEAVSSKADGTPVTAADVETDERLRAGIRANLPGHGIVSEEGDTRAPNDTWTWVIDPIDGTSNYTTGLPYWCVSMSLTFEGRPVLGIVDAPALHRRYVALDGRGAQRNGLPIRVRTPVDMGDRANRHIAVLLTTAAARRARDAGIRLNVRVLGSTALDLALVADGSAVASLAIIPHVWDIAAGHVLLRESGGTVVTWRDDPLLPLKPGQDYAGQSAATASAATAAYAGELAQRLVTPPPGTSDSAR